MGSTTAVSEGLLDAQRRADYLIMVALNGPGISSMASLKWAITARIRAYCRMSATGAAVRYHPLSHADQQEMLEGLSWLRTMFASPDRREYGVKLREVVRHWISHANLALNVLPSRIHVSDNSLMTLTAFVGELQVVVSGSISYLDDVAWQLVYDALTKLVRIEREAGETFDQFVWKEAE